MAITTRDGMIAAIAAGQRISYYKASQTAEAAGTWHSLLKAAGFPAPAAASPTAYGGGGDIPTNTLLGSMNHTDPGGANKLYLMGWSHAGATAGRMILYDRVWCCSGFTTNGANPTTLTTVGEANITRPANWLGLEIWLEVYGAPGATGSTWTVAYVDAADANQTAVYTHPANAESVGQMMPCVMTVNTGVKSIASFTHTVASGTAGDIGVTVLRRIAEFPNTLINAGDSLDAFFLGMPEILTDASLNLMVLCSATNTGIAQGTIILGEG
jgi:hypothetical protein